MKHERDEDERLECRTDTPSRCNAPYPAASRTLIQQELSDGELTAGAVAWHGVASGIVPLGTALGGPLIALLGPRSTLTVSAIATVLLAAVFTAFIRQRSA